MRIWVLAGAILLIATQAHSASREVQYGPPPSWVMPSPTPTNTAPPQGAPVQLVYADSQARFGPDNQESYTAYRIKLLTPEGLAAGNLTASWNPSTDDIFIHELKIIRAGQVIDVLKTNKFQVIQRENNLAYDMLDGDLTATLQTPGLQIGDEIEFSATIRRHDAIFGNRAYGFGQLPFMGAVGAYRIYFTWPSSKNIRWNPTPDLGALAIRDVQGRRELTYEVRDPNSSVLIDGAPNRLNLRRAVEYSEFANWGELSSALWPMFDKAAVLRPGSPIREEAAKIAGSTPDPTARAEAALRLVQDQIRYVYVGLDGGNYRPSTADETWERRFGDCKAKTVLLLALLRELGIPGEAVLVNSNGGDGADQRLPTPAAFDHVLVRATIDGKAYWLDGTRIGDRRLAALPAPTSLWGLPIRQGAVDLEPIPIQPPTIPQFSVLMDIDARGGFDVAAKVKAEEIWRGVAAVQLRSRLASMSHEDSDRALQAYWREQAPWVDASGVSWRYDDTQNSLLVTLAGEGKPDWDGDDEDGRDLVVYGAGFNPPAEFRRPKEQDQAAPWLTDFPTYRRWTTLIRLPPATRKWRWDYGAAPVRSHLGGVSYWRDSDLSGGVLRTTMSRRVFKLEITAAEAQAVNDGLKTFDNKMSRVFQVSTRPEQPAYKPHKGAVEPDWGEAALRLLEAAQVADKAGHSVEATSDLDQALKLEPENPAVRRGRGEHFRRLGRHEEALEEFDEAWRINPLDGVMLAARVQELRDLGRSEEAEALVAADKAMVTPPAPAKPAPAVAH